MRRRRDRAGPDEPGQTGSQAPHCDHAKDTPLGLTLGAVNRHGSRMLLSASMRSHPCAVDAGSRSVGEQAARVQDPMQASSGHLKGSKMVALIGCGGASLGIGAVEGHHLCGRAARGVCGDGVEEGGLAGLSSGDRLPSHLPAPLGYRRGCRAAGAQRAVPQDCGRPAGTGVLVLPRLEAGYDGFRLQLGSVGYLQPSTPAPIRPWRPCQPAEIHKCGGARSCCVPGAELVSLVPCDRDTGVAGRE